MSGPREPEPVLTAHLFPELLQSLLESLSALSPDGWAKPVPRKSWTVNDVALHLVGGDVGLLARERDGFVISSTAVGSGQELVEALKTLNDTWIAAGRRISPRLLHDLLRFTGRQVSDYVRSLDPHALGGAVSWAGPDPAPNWLCIGQEFTERWHHQQHIRAALGSAGLDAARYLRPALDIFLRALPHTYRAVEAPEGTSVGVSIAGDSGGEWLLVREQRTWKLYTGRASRPAAEVVIPQQAAWKLFTRWLLKEEAMLDSEVRGDPVLASRVFETVAVIA